MAINSGSPVDKSVVANTAELFMDVNQQIELCNSIAIPHKQRYSRCSTDEERSKELDNMLSDYREVFKAASISFISEDLLRCYFLLMVTQNFASTEFREIFVDLLERVKVCEIAPVKLSILQRMLWICVRGHLYGKEPFDSIMAACTQEYEALVEQYGNIVQISFLE